MPATVPTYWPSRTKTSAGQRCEPQRRAIASSSPRRTTPTPKRPGKARCSSGSTTATSRHSGKRTGSPVKNSSWSPGRAQKAAWLASSTQAAPGMAARRRTSGASRSSRGDSRVAVSVMGSPSGAAGQGAQLFVAHGGGQVKAGVVGQHRGPAHGLGHQIERSVDLGGALGAQALAGAVDEDQHPIAGGQLADQGGVDALDLAASLDPGPAGRQPLEDLHGDADAHVKAPGPPPSGPC